MNSKINLFFMAIEDFFFKACLSRKTKKKKDVKISNDKTITKHNKEITER